MDASGVVDVDGVEKGLLGTGLFDTGLFGTGLFGMDASGVGVINVECDDGRNAYSWTIFIAKLSSSSIFSTTGNRLFACTFFDCVLTGMSLK